MPGIRGGFGALVAALALLGTGRPVVGQEQRSLDPPVLLPDGTEFLTWEKPRVYTKTYHVNQSHPTASDENPGTEAEPFKTIDRAAQVLQPGELVLVGEGVYREWVRPRRGGTGPDAMIGYHAAPGAKVVIKGSRVAKTVDAWDLSREGPGWIWHARLTEGLFEGDNPFREVNISVQQFEWMDWARPQKGKLPYVLTPALVFLDGKRFEQVPDETAVKKTRGSFCVVDAGARIIFRTYEGGDDAEGGVLEVTTQRSVFAPEMTGLGYIHVKGFTVEHAGNPFPMPQYGAISTTRGHHWIIEDCTVRWANGVGIDIGTQFWGLPQPPVTGHHIVRRNTVTDCGVCGIAGLKAVSCLIEDNVLLRNAFHDAEHYYETASIKTHLNESTLIRHNLIDGTLHGSGIWIDFANVNTRCTRNVILRTNTIHAGIFLEASTRPNLVDQNVIWDTRGNGIYEHDGHGQVFAHNLIGKSTGAGIRSAGKVTDRKVHGEPIVGGSHRILNNVLVDNKKPVDTRGPASEIEGNMTEDVVVAMEPATVMMTWFVKGPIAPVRWPGTITHDFFAAPRTAPTALPGPFIRIPSASEEVRLWRAP